MNPFYNIELRPSHGSRSVVITWQVEPEFSDLPVYVSFSPTGVKGSWQALNQTNPVTNDLMYVDDKFVMENGVDIGYYRLMVIKDNEPVFSDIKGILDFITRREYNIARKIIKDEFLSMRARNGRPVYHCIPREHGELADGVDPETGEKYGVDCPDDPDSSYGERYKGGFYTPCLTWMRPMTVDLGTVTDRPDGTGVKDSHKIQARLLGFPRPKRGHMIVDPQTDDRFYVGESIKPYLLRGQIAVAYETNLMLIPRSDPRYKFPVPPIVREQLRQIPR